MKQLFNLKHLMVCVCMPVLLLTMNACSNDNDDDGISAGYFNCKVNGQAYETPKLLTNFSSNCIILPNFFSSVKDGKYAILFTTDISPKNNSTTLPNYRLVFNVYGDTPLAIGEKYTFSVIPEKQVVTGEDICLLQEDNISFVALALEAEANMKLGRGTLQLTKISKEEQWIDGVVEFEFSSLVEQTPIQLKGEFHCYLASGFYYPLD